MFSRGDKVYYINSENEVVEARVAKKDNFTYSGFVVDKKTLIKNADNKSKSFLFSTDLLGQSPQEAYRLAYNKTKNSLEKYNEQFDEKIKEMDAIEKITTHLSNKLSVLKAKHNELLGVLK